MNSLTDNTALLRQLPTFELSYETVSHKKVSTQDAIALAISLGRKYFVWYTHTYGSAEDACYLVGLDKDKRVCSIEPRTCPIPKGFGLGTVVYGTIYEVPEKTSVFLAEDIYYFSGVNLSNLCFGDRLGFLRDFVRYSKSIDIALPMMWFASAGKEQSHVIPNDIASKMGYVAHHIQYREIKRVAPYINVVIPKRGTIPSAVVAPVSSAKVAQKMTAAAIMKPIPSFDYSKPSYRYPAVFNVTADPQLDLYHLYAYGGPDSAVYCGLAGVQSFRTSVFLNRIFRRIRENENLDFAEESEDEADFENTDENKYVNLETVASIECVFNQKHKKWIPVRLSKDKLIHVEKLVMGTRYKK
jgi:hypothetical protein